MVMNSFDKIIMPLGIGRRNKFHFTPNTTCTQDFFSLRPVFSTELMPSADISVSQSYFCRLSPMAKPLLGSARLINRAFFVPYRILMPGFNDMIADTNYARSGSAVRYSKVPSVKQSVLCDAIVNSGGVTNGTSNDYDFAYYIDGTLTYGKFNEKGRNIYAILCGLGYSLSFGFQSEDDPANISVSLMKVLAYFKIVADWYVYNNFYSRADNINVLVKQIGETLEPTTSQISALFNLACYSTLDNDYFTTASVSPVTPPGSSSVDILDITNDKRNSGSSASAGYASSVSSLGTAGNTVPSTPSIKGITSDATPSGANVPGNITQYVLNALQALTIYMQRNNLVGYKTLDRLKARFGVELDSDKLNRSKYLGSNSSPLQIAEVLSNADTKNTAIGTTGAALGDYVGRGIAADKNARFHYKNNNEDFGVFIVLSTIIPDVRYGQGISRDNLHINRFDFFTPEFDALGMQAIARAELFNDAKDIDTLSSLRTFAPNEAFGFQNMYAEYCKMNDILAGDFRRRNMLDIRGFHLYRMFNEPGVDGSLDIKDYKTISENFVVGNPSEYNKIFNYRGTDYDHFYVSHSWDVTLVQPKKRLMESYELDHMNPGAPTVTMSNKGTKLN